MPFTPTEEQRAGMIEHILYEIRTCFFLSEGEVEFPKKFPEAWISHMVHARVLLKFLDTKAKDARDDDTISEHFGFAAREVKLDVEHWNRFNKDVHHLSYKRLRHTQETKGWPIMEVLLPLKQRVIEFMEHVLKDFPKEAKQDEKIVWQTMVDRLKSY